MQHPRLALYLYLLDLCRKLGTDSDGKCVATQELINWAVSNGKGRIRFVWPSKAKKVQLHELQVLESGRSPKLVSEWVDDYRASLRMELDKVVRHLAKVDSSQESLRDAYQGSPLISQDSEFVKQFATKFVGPVLTRVHPMMKGYFIISEEALGHLLTVLNFRL